MSPIYGQEIHHLEHLAAKDAQHLSGEDDGQEEEQDFAQKIADQKQRSKRLRYLREQKNQNQNMVDSIFWTGKLNTNESINLKQQSFVNTHARRFKSQMRIRLDKKGYIDENEYGVKKGSTQAPADLRKFSTIDMKRLIVKDFLQTPLSGTNSSLNQSLRFKFNKDYGNNSRSIDPNMTGLSLKECLSTQKRVDNMTIDYQMSCGGGHPSYEQGYNPRHYNYLQSSGQYTNFNTLNICDQPNLMEETNKQRRRLQRNQMMQQKSTKLDKY